VTVFGQSAGGYDIGMLLVSPLSKGLFARAIEESGTVAIGAHQTSTLAEAEKHGVDLAAKMNAPATGTIAYMRRLSAADVLRASPPYGRGGLAAVVDGYVILGDAAKSFAAGREDRVPLLIGNNAREMTFGGNAEALQKAIDGFYESLAPQATALYAKPSDYPPYGSAGSQFVTDTFMRCPTVAIADFHADAGNPVWEYEFSHPFPEATQGAAHSGELRYIFGVFPPGPVADSERKISSDMETYWTNFARTGNPNGGGLPVWPKYDVKTRSYLEFTDGGPMPRQNLRGAYCQLWTEFLKQNLAK
jgi:para-nitrobenzyl esterase